MASPVTKAFTVAEAATALGVTTMTVYRWLASGKLERMFLAGGNTALVTVKSIERMEQQLAARR